MNYKQYYDERKDNVIKVLKESVNFYTDIDDFEKASSLSDLASAVENGKFSIVVVGQFSAGKSTFLNALMGEKYLPSFQSETTATVNFLKSVKDSPTGKPLIKINYKDGKVDECEDVTLENIEKYVSTRGEDVAKKISSVEVFLDSPYLNDGVSLVDSPGLNGLLEGHEQITYEQIARSHAAIFMFNAKQPGSKSDFEKLNDLIAKCDSVLIVLNQKDLINESEETTESVVAKVKENYAKYFNTDILPEIYPIASLPALVGRSSRNLEYNKRSDFTKEEKDGLIDMSDIKTFEERLFKYLTEGEKAQKELLSPVERVRSYLNETDASLALRIDELSKTNDTDELKQQINVLKDELDELSSKLQGGRSDIRRKVGEVLTNARNQLKSSASDVRNNCIKQIEDAEDLDELEQNSQLYLNRLSSKYFNIWEDVKTMAENDYKELIRSQYDEYANAVEERLHSQKEDSKIQFAAVKLDTSMFEIDVDIEDFLEQRQQILEKIDSQTETLDKLEIDRILAQRNEKKRERLEKQKDRAHENKTLDKQSLGGKPGVETYTSYEESKVGGVKGFFNWVWKGSRKKYEPVVHTDTSARDNYLNQQKEIEERYNKEIEQLEAKINAIPESDPERIQFEQDKIKRAMNRQEKLLADLRDDYEKKNAKERRSKERKAKAYIEGVLDDIEKENISQIYTMLDNQKDKLTNALIDVLQLELQSVISRKKEEIEIRERQLSCSQDEKNKLVESMTKSRKTLSELKSEADACAIEIESIKADKIIRS